MQAIKRLKNLGIWPQSLQELRSKGKDIKEPVHLLQRINGRLTKE